jgi:hypothetical protein
MDRILLYDIDIEGCIVLFDSYLAFQWGWSSVAHIPSLRVFQKFFLELEGVFFMLRWFIQ